MLQIILLVLLILDCIAMVAVILMQRSEGGALGMGGGGGGLMTARGAGNLLTRTTGVLASVFFVLCVGLVILGNVQRSQSLVNRLGATLRAGPQTAPIMAAPPTKTQGPQQPASSLGALETGNGPVTLQPSGGAVSGLPQAQPSAPSAKAPSGAAKK
jgi:preprotein translocase subunit SecG